MKISLLYTMLFGLALPLQISAQPTQPAPLDVTAFGAVPDDGIDDSDAIQAAIDAARAGQTIRLPAGTFNIAHTLNPRGFGRIIQGSTTLRWDGDHVVAGPQQTILKSSADHFLFYFSEGEGITFTNLTFAGRAISADRPDNGLVKGLVVDNCWFDLNVTGERTDAIEFTTALADSRITNCVFNPIKGDNAIYGYNWSNLVIANNHFLNGNEAIHLIAHWDDSKNLLIEQNYFAGLHRMAIEIQGGGVNTVVQDNYYEKPVLSSREQDNDDTFAYSIISDRSRGTRIRRNTSIAPQRPDGIGVRIIFELGGHDLICEDNYSIAGNHVIAGNGAGATGVARNNRISGFREGPRNSNGAKLQFLNNDPNVPLTWDIDRGIPGPNKRLPAAKVR